jgi:hypothetical protein
MLKRLVASCVVLTLLNRCVGDIQSPFRDVDCEGDYQHHLQGVCTNEKDAVYWSFTTQLVKTSPAGKVQKSIPVVSHHGDVCFHKDQIFVAVNLGSFNDPKGNADSWVYVYDASSLKFVAKHETQEVFHGAGGIGIANNRFFVVGGLPDGVQENYVYEYDLKFKFIKKHVINSKWTRLGIQSATFHDGAWWFGCYGSPAILLKTDARFQMLGRYEFDCSLGIVGIGKDRLLVAKGPRTEAKRCLGSLHLARPDAKKGLVFLPKVINAQDKKRVTLNGPWRVDRFRYAANSHVSAQGNESALEMSFTGRAISIRLGGHNVPAYGGPNLGTVSVSIDGKQTAILRPRELPREVTLASGLESGEHQLKLSHLTENGLAGCRIESFKTWDDERGELRFRVSGDENAFLVDCRAILRRGGTIIRNALVRNWLTGQCSLTGLPPGDDYSLEIRAVGWQSVTTPEFKIEAGQLAEIPAIYLRRDPATVIGAFRFPRINQPAIRKPGESLRLRFLAYKASIDEVKLIRRVGSATISRVIDFAEDEAAAYYYDREVVATLPDDMPSGVYDVSVGIKRGTRNSFCRSPRSVHVVSQYPTDPVLVTFGHLDTSGQYQAEYLQRLVQMINLIGPDMVLCGTAVNPGYLTGALADLEMPYAITFGNHQFYGHEKWYGDPVGLIDFGPDLSVLNFGHPWHVGDSLADELLSSRSQTRVIIINAFESNAPLDLLNRHKVRMIHDAHGIGKRVDELGATPTKRIGKMNAESFRIVRFKDAAVESCTYQGDELAPIPFGRGQQPPLRVTYTSENNGRNTENVATVSNGFADAISNGRVTFVMPAGKYQVNKGRIESQVSSDNGQFVIVRVRIDLPPNGEVQVKIRGT